MKKAIKILESRKDLSSLSLGEALVKGGMDKDLVTKIFVVTGYPHLLKSNAESALCVCRQDYIQNQTYYLFKPGLESLVETMIEQLKKKYSQRFKVVDGLVRGWSRSKEVGFVVDYVNNNGIEKKINCSRMVELFLPII